MRERKIRVCSQQDDADTVKKGGRPIKVTPTKTMQFQGRISMIDASAKHEQFILEDNGNKHYVLDKDFEIRTQFQTPYERYTLSAIHPKEPYIATMGKDNILHIVDLNGVDIWTKPGEYIAACWTLDGAELYTLLRLDSHTLKLIVYNNAGEAIAEKEFKDELYESFALLSTIPNHTEMTMHLMAGQDGCLTVFVSLSGDNIISLRFLHDYYSYTCASFNESGSQFLCIENDERSIYHFTYPELKEIGKREFDALDFTLIYLDNKAIIRCNENFYLLDVNTMEIAEDFIIAGHEPVPTCEIYKRLKDDSLMCDISYLCSTGKHILGHANREGLCDIVVLDKEAHYGKRANTTNKHFA